MIWWGRSDPNYSRNRIVRKLLADLGWRIIDFQPLISQLGDVEAVLRHLPKTDLVWVPCFRQRDMKAALRWAASRQVPLVFDPLISAYDKQVDERRKLQAGSRKARRLLAWERSLFQNADRVIADTPAHAKYFAEVLGVDKKKLSVVYVGAEEALFTPAPLTLNSPLEVLFYGSFIPLQGPEVVVEAARIYQGPPVKWTLVGEGPLKAACEVKARGLNNLSFEDWLSYEQLPARIHRAHILLGVFGTTPKADRVIPNKVFQSLACGRVVVTRAAESYPVELSKQDAAGLVWCKAGDAQSLVSAIAGLAAQVDKVATLGQNAAVTSQQYFSTEVVRRQLSAVLDVVNN
jgi:glycosyltransferase involved in cell wall biosynthesis